MLRHIPMWRVLAHVDASTEVRTVSAFNAHMVPEEIFFTEIRPVGPFVVESEVWRPWLRDLGAMDVELDVYISKHLVPLIEAMPKGDPARITTFGTVLAFINNDTSLAALLAGDRLVPNRNEDLCRAADLYDPSEPIFAASFAGDGSKLPHNALDIKDMRKLGFVSSVTKTRLRVCFECLDLEYRAGGSEDLRQRAGSVWMAFCNRFGEKIENWRPRDIKDLANYHFIPVHQFKGETVSYRDRTLATSGDSMVLAALEEVVLPEYMAISWTKMCIPEYPPALWITRLFDFMPTVDQVVKHLVELATVVAPKCDLAEAKFFQDLKATYDHLSRPENIQQVIKIIKEQHSKDAVWLNEDVSLENISQLQRQNYPSIGSLSWLAANRLVEGISYDVSHYNLHPIKTSVKPYQSLVRSIGLNIVRDVEVPTLPETRERHSDVILNYLKTTQRSEEVCDMTIVIGDTTHYVHRLVFGNFFIVLPNDGKLELETRPTDSREYRQCRLRH